MRRQGVAVGAGAVALCLGGWFAVGGDGGADKGFVAVGAAGAGSEGNPTKAVPPEGKVELVPLDPASPNSPPGQGGSGRRVPGSAGPPDAAGSGSEAPGSPGPGSAAPGAFAGTVPGPGSGSAGQGSRTPAGNAPAGDSPAGSGAPGSGGGGEPSGAESPGSGPPSKPSRPSQPSQPTPPKPPQSKPPQSKPRPPAPAALSVGSPVRAKADQRWCEKVTVSLRNSGGTAVRSGTVTFATHIIGALGVDWGTRTSSQPLPGSIGPGAARSATYTVCVDAWRVPLGMHVETRRVTATWK